MKNKLLPLLVVLGSYSAYSQVGIGTLNPNGSAQLQIKSENRGLLIPNVKLAGLTDASPIIGLKDDSKDEAKSLLVFNTETVPGMTPGFYYWLDKKWHRLAAADEISGGTAGAATGTGVPKKRGEVDYPGDNVLLYTDTVTNTVYIQNPDGTWLPINGAAGNNGKDGMIGGDGAPGTVIIMDHF
ncbi:hypothetical protein KHA90_01520 [Flavobacterium psychroterrae]|uniref:Uncharacterized protein n=1 Tax=Flavobacterium psychroterrae TaxID=2133767 RepID=A0ABS5P608_9FLAO|nr:hypothetical protein [Flavobacterium psychroterrae]MBS7229689.1 hypothetical protein [Flavobacterium psychroterrae]